MSYLLDTCVISELLKPDYNTNVMNWISNENFESIFLSVITIGEIWKGICKLPDSLRKSNLNQWLESEVIRNYNKKIIPVDFKVIMTWGKLSADLELKGRKMPVIDLFLASTAIANNLTLVTRNTKDFINSGCEIFNPWQ